MENSTEKGGGAEIGVGIPKEKRSMDLKIFDKSRAYEVGGSDMKVPEGNGDRNVEKRKSDKEVCLSDDVSDAKKGRRMLMGGDEVDASQIMSDLTKGLHGVSFARGHADKLGIFPKRPRGSIGSVNLETDQISEPLGVSKSVDSARAFNEEVIIIEDDTGDEVAGDEVASNSKSAGKAGGSNLKLKAQACAGPAGEDGGSNLKLKINEGSPSTAKVDCPNSKSKQSVDLNSAGEVRGSNAKLKEKARAKPVGEVGASNTKLKENVDLISIEEEDCSNPNLKLNLDLNKEADLTSPEEVIGSNPTSKPRFDFDLNQKLPDSESIEEFIGSSSKSKPNWNFDLNEVPELEDLEEDEPPVTSSVPGSIFIDLVSDDEDDNDDEVNLEQNAERMLSSRFGPSCTGSSSGVGPASGDDVELEPPTEDKGKGVMRKRRHYYDIIPNDVDENWFLSKRIKVFWPSDQSWHHGVVNEYHSESKFHQIKYDNRKEEWVVLEEENFKILLFPSEIPEKSKSRKRSRKVKTATKEDDDRCMETDLDSEPLALWLAHSSRRVKSVPKSSTLQRISDMQRSDDPSLSSEKNEIVKRRRRNRDHESASSNKLNGCSDGTILVYCRRKNLKIGEASLWMVNGADLIEDNRNVALVGSTRFRFQICLPLLLHFKDVSFGTWDLRLLHNMWMLQHGSIVTISHAVNLHMLFVDSYEGIKFLLHEGCMKEALAFVFSILNAFAQPDEQWNKDVQFPFTSIRFRLSSIEDVRKYRVFEFHSFSPMSSSKWLSMDSKLLRRCLLVKQLPVSECTYDNIKELSSYAGILPMEISREACNTRNVQSVSSAPTCFLTPHLQSLMENSFAWVNPQHDNESASWVDPFEKITVDIPSSDQDDMSFDLGSSDVRWSPNEGLLRSPKRRRSSRSRRRSSISSHLENLTPMWPNGPKRPRTHVRYTLPKLTKKQKTQNENSLPCKRIRQASQKRSNKKNLYLISCSANVLITHEDKGWRECGADVLLEASDRNEWKLVVKFSGVTKYSYKAKHVLPFGTTNRYSHCVMWKSGNDWVLEFPDRKQWALFKEMHKECYNRNVRAASVKHIQIPGVKLVEEIDDVGINGPFVRNPVKYFRQVQTDVEMAIDPSRVLYDMDSDDEEWCKSVEISDELFEKIIDIFEKASYVQRCDSFSDYEIKELVMGVGSVEAGKVIYEYWREKRDKMGVPLIRHLQPPLWERYQERLKEWERILGNSENPPTLAFCHKPVPNAHHESHLGSRRKSKRRAIIDATALCTSATQESSEPRGRRRPKIRKLSSIASSQDKEPTVNKSGVKTGLTEFYRQELHAREALRAAQHARHVAKLKRAKAHKLQLIADVAIQKAAAALMTAEAIKAACEN